MTSIDREAQKMADDLAAKSPTNTSVDGEAAKLADLYKPHASAESIKPENKITLPAGKYYTSVDREAEEFHGNKRG